MLDIRVKYVDNELQSRSPLPLPVYAKDGDAGVDLRSAEELVLLPGHSNVVKTNIALAIPTGYCGYVIPRSGLAAKHGITVVNAPGLIDSGYRGEIMVILHNLGKLPFEIKYGDRIAQLVISKYESVNWVQVNELDETERGEGRFGHTGV